MGSGNSREERGGGTPAARQRVAARYALTAHPRRPRRPGCSRGNLMTPWRPKTSSLPRCCGAPRARPPVLIGHAASHCLY